MAVYNVKPLEHYIEKHGVKKGTMIYERELKKKAKYDNQPYVRMTKEWFVWRYGEVDGLKRFESHVSKSTQSLENFVSRYGEEKGRRKYDETMAKKDTNSLASIAARESLTPEEAKVLHEAITEKKRASIAAFFDNLEDKKSFLTSRANKALKTKIERYGTLSTGEIIRQRSEEEYIKYKKAISPTAPCFASKESMVIINEILDGLDLSGFSVHYGCKEKTRREYKIYDSVTSRYYSYDLTIIGNGLKLVMEYDGANYHPTKEEAEDKGCMIMPAITTKTYKQVYEFDCYKKALVKKHGFILFTMRSDISKAEKTSMINKIRELIQNVSVY